MNGSADGRVTEKRKAEKIMNIGNSIQKWHDLLLYMQNATPTSFCLIFPDVKTAQDAASRLVLQVEKYPSWFPMVISRRGSKIYVTKTNFAQKMVIKDEPAKREEC